jgi:alpha-tubulin suppressor-like RCC1 family protein
MKFVLSLFIVLCVCDALASTPLSGVAQVSAGYDHSCATLSNGTVKCWGGNARGQLGNGSTLRSPHPVDVLGITNATYVVAGEAFSCAVLADTTVKCWGSADYGNSGDARMQPVAIPGVTGVTQISAGLRHVCVVLASREVYCWGSADEGQVHIQRIIGFPISDPRVPHQAPGITTAELIISGGYSSCVRLADGGYKCWGRSMFPDYPSSFAVLAPISIPSLSDTTKLALGSGHGCAVYPDQSLRCWGNGSSGQLGGGIVQSTVSPVTVPGVTAPTSVVALGSTTCASFSNGTARCWGSGQRGQIGNDAARRVLVPTLVASSFQFETLSGSSSHVCAKTNSGTTACWGEGANGQLGDGITLPRLLPFRPVGVANVKDFVLGEFGFSCAIEPDDKVSCMGSLPIPNEGVAGNKPLLIPGVENVMALGAGTNHACALTQVGHILCWGVDGYGPYLGGATIDWTGTAPPTPVAGVPVANHLSVGNYHSCAVTTTGRVWCWGYNPAGQLGSPGYSEFPVEVPGLVDAVRVSAGFDYSCALRSNGTVRCWGNYRPGFRDLPGISTAVNLRADESVVCARLSDGTLKCFVWDVDESNNLIALPPTWWSPDLPATLGPSSATAPWKAGSNLCQIAPTGKLECIGNGIYGLLGNGGLADVETPVQVKNVTQSKSMTGSAYARCAVENSGQVWCWGGEYGGGALGASASDFQQVPVLVESATSSATVVIATTPSPSETWAPYVVRVRVATTGANPASGAVRIADDTGGSCGSGPLDLLGEGSCALVSSRRGARNLTVSFVPDSPGVANSSATSSHNVVTSCDLDVDGDGAVRAQTDGIMLVRGLLGLADQQIVHRAINANGTRTDPAAVGNHIRKMVANGALSPAGNSFTQLGDQLTLLRVLSGFSGEGNSIYPELRFAAQHFATVCNFVRE